MEGTKFREFVVKPAIPDIARRSGQRHFPGQVRRLP